MGISPVPPFPLPDPLANLSDEDLFSSQLALYLACGRARGTLKKKHRTHLCYLGSLLDLEAAARGKPNPPPPWKV